MDAGYGLGRFLGDYRPALPEGRKSQMVITKLCQLRRPIVLTNLQQIWVSFSLEVHLGTVGIYHTGLWGFLEAFHQCSGLA